MKTARLSVALCVVFLLGACTTTTERLQRYAGQDIREVMVDYGEPGNAFDMPDGLRAFQWIVHSSYTTPTHVSTHRVLRNKKDPDSWITSNVTIHGGDVVESSCLYTLLAHWDEQRQGWIVSSNHKPRVSCQ